MMQKLNGIEASRGLAALLVVLMHTSSLLSGTRYLGEAAMGGLWTFGHAGVDFFFVLSGFIIYHVHSGDISHPARLGSYWRKRLIRVYPTYWVVLAGYGVLLYFSPSKDHYEQSLQAVVTNVLLIPQAHTPILGVAWSLCHEILFYLLFSVFFLKRSIGRLLFTLWLLGILVNVLFHATPATTVGQFVFNPFNLEFFFGMTCACLLKRGMTLRAKESLLLGLTGFFGTGLLESLVLGRQLNHVPLHMAYATFSALIIYGLVVLEQAGRLRIGRPLVLLGQSSYSIYLVHVVVIMLFQQFYLQVLATITLPGTLIFVLCVGTAVFSGIFFSQRIEQPMLRWLRRSRKPIPSQPTSPPGQAMPETEHR